MRLEANKVRVLLAEDNEINREVVQDILDPLGMHIDAVENGEEAVEKVLSEKYDFIFMDYLMPVLDGAKATMKIRHIEGREDLKDIPIIALTASADETDKLIDAGMNDFIIKPLNYDTAVEKLVKWLPKGSVYAVYDEEKEEKKDDDIPVIEGIDVNAGIANSGSLRLLKKLFIDFARVIDFKAETIEKYLAENRIDDYRIEVHALKSSSNLIGAVSLSKDFALLEKKAKDNELQGIEEETQRILEEYRGFKDKLKDYGTVKYSQTVEVSSGRVKNILKKIISDADEFFLDGVDLSLTELDKCVLPDYLKEDFEKLRVYIADVSMANAVALCRKMIDKLDNSEG